MELLAKMETFSTRKKYETCKRKLYKVYSVC
jgi:hypothetical protein